MKFLTTMKGRLETLKKLAVCAVLFLMCASVQAQSKDFKKLSKIDGVEHIHINKFLLKLAAMNDGGINVGKGVVLGNNSDNMLEKIDVVDVYTSDKKDAVEEMGKKVRDILNVDGWEPLVDVNEKDGERVKIYQKKKGKQCTFVVFAEEEKEASLVMVKGEIDLAKMLEQKISADEETSID